MRGFLNFAFTSLAFFLTLFLIVGPFFDFNLRENETYIILNIIAASILGMIFTRTTTEKKDLVKELSPVTELNIDGVTIDNSLLLPELYDELRKFEDILEEEIFFYEKGDKYVIEVDAVVEEGFTAGGTKEQVEEHVLDVIEKHTGTREGIEFRISFKKVTEDEIEIRQSHAPSRVELKKAKKKGRISFFDAFKKEDEEDESEETKERDVVEEFEDASIEDVVVEDEEEENEVEANEEEEEDGEKESEKKQDESKDKREEDPKEEGEETKKEDVEDGNSKEEQEEEK